MPAPFWHLPPDHWIAELACSPMGLSTQNAERRLRASGAVRKTTSRLHKDLSLLLRQFRSPLMLLLIGAVLLSAFLGEKADVFFILFVLVSTSLLGFFQERNAGRVVEKLQSMIAIKCTVLRDEKMVDIPAAQVVPGDVLVFNAGDMIPADCILLEAQELHTNEASLTGETFPVRKSAGVVDVSTELSKRVNCLWEGTSIVSGNAKALAVYTADKTLFGSVVQSTSKVVETAFEKGLGDFGYLLMRITLFLSIVILVVNLLTHKSLVESALFALALAVGMAPELLPAITTIAMSAGARRMLDKKVIVKNLSSIQNLGEVNLLCTDKTGTITEGAIVVEKLTDAFGQDSEKVKTLAFWNAYFQTGYNNPIDEALKKLDVPTAALPKKLDEIPYDFIRKRLSIVVGTEKGMQLVSKGAYLQVMEVCTQVLFPDGRTEDIKNYRVQIDKLFELYGEKGFRVLAVAYKDVHKADLEKEDEADMVFAGFILFQDPVKEGIEHTIAALKQLRVGLKIITGDNKNIAKSIGEQIGIHNPVVMTGRELFDMSPEAMALKVKAAHIFAEVEPQQKERIIVALRKSYTVAYLGDGINDVSAINAADIGICVENAVDVAREAADFVLMEKALSVLVDGIKEGRRTFANTLKYIYISTGSTFGNMISVALASFFLPFLPMLPSQILLTNLISDFPYLTVVSDNVDEEEIEKPGKWDLKVIKKYMLVFGAHSSFFDIFTFSVLYFALKNNASAFQTGWFIESVLTELLILFVMRTHGPFLRSRPGKYLFLFTSIGLVVTLGLPYMPFASGLGLVPLPWKQMLALLGVILAYVLTAEWLKIWFFRRHEGGGRERRRI